ncbi:MULTISPECIES: DUF7848 domain-containing protein [unclassified Streptomyces]|uniref:DUF7848 domain-containing protein n=1 Tax=unclassified Streptomyces TaxID=2593676 RepID=UPI000DAB7EEB|nr:MULTISPECIES: hypothetical protein [unclassified Streptomyces]PZT76332.1 hypothetical protein DNK56_23585 [Streptomyces sp. AC1-42W]PZT79714.1 hypothetical protein DNK55_09100 [Streptomyces sp. AC1-42T]
MSPVSVVVRHVTWTLTPDREPDAEPVTYKLGCAVCPEAPEPSQDWVNPPLAYLQERRARSALVI